MGAPFEVGETSSFAHSIKEILLSSRVLSDIIYRSVSWANFWSYFQGVREIVVIWRVVYDMSPIQMTSMYELSHPEREYDDVRIASRKKNLIGNISKR